MSELFLFKVRQRTQEAEAEAEEGDAVICCWLLALKFAHLFVRRLVRSRSLIHSINWEDNFIRHTNGRTDRQTDK